VAATKGISRVLLNLPRFVGHLVWEESMSSKESPPGSGRGRFTPEFKADAVSMVIDGDRSIVDVVRRLGLVEQTLGNWVRQAPDRQAVAPRRLASEPQAHRAVDARERHRRGAQAPSGAHHDPGRGQPADPGSDRAWLRPGQPRCRLVRRHHPHPHRRGLALPRLAVLDLGSRRLLGYSMACHMRTELVTDALDMAVATRGGEVNSVIFHGDRGSQYLSGEYRARLADLGMRQSVGRTGVCWDKACGSHCTSWRGLGGNSVSDGASLPGDEAGVAGCRWLEEPDVLVVGLVQGEQSGVVPCLDRAVVHAELVGDLVDGEQAAAA
jgi:transposase InsO family protein